MKHLFIAGNWKSNKGIAETEDWLRQFSVKWKDIGVVLCVPFTLLYLLKEEIARLQLPIKLGAQDVSAFGEGAYTGEINAGQIKELADWVIIGHSERRKNLKETDDMLAQKVVQAQNAGLKIIYCVQDEHIPIPVGIDVVAYEPPWAISAVSNWKTQDPQVAGQVCALIKKRYPELTVLYGGSANAENVQSFILQPSIEGILSGGASLDPVKFANLIKNAIIASS